MENQIKQPYHTERIVMEFDRKSHIMDVAYEALVVCRLTLTDVTLCLDGWKFTVTPHMDVPEVIEAYAKQPGWLVGPLTRSQVENT